MSEAEDDFNKIKGYFQDALTRTGYRYDLSYSVEDCKVCARLGQILGKSIISKKKGTEKDK